MYIYRDHPLALHPCQTKQAGRASSLAGSPLPCRHAAFLCICSSYRALNVGDQNHTRCLGGALSVASTGSAHPAPPGKSWPVLSSEQISCIRDFLWGVFPLRPFWHIFNWKGHWELWLPACPSLSSLLVSFECWWQPWTCRGSPCQSAMNIYHGRHVDGQMMSSALLLFCENLTFANSCPVQDATSCPYLGWSSLLAVMITLGFPKIF